MTSFTRGPVPEHGRRRLGAHDLGGVPDGWGSSSRASRCGCSCAAGPPTWPAARLKLGAIVSLVAAAALGLTGDQDAKIMVQQQPMKMAAAEALYETAQPAPFSILTIGTLDGSEPLFTVEIPGALSFLATGTFDGKVEGINNLEAQYQESYGEQFGLDSYTPNIPITYWGFRFMIGFGMLGALFALIGLVGRPQGSDPVVQVADPDGDPRPADAAAGQQRRMDLHRDGPAAVDRLRPDADG